MIRIDCSNLMRDSIGENGLTTDDFRQIDTARFDGMLRARRYAELGWLDLPGQDIAPIKEMGRFAGRFETLLILGIGGSALGPRSILEALHPFHNLRAAPKVFIYDNVDPMTLAAILDMTDLGRTVINVITKSGSTAETIASFMILWQRLQEAALEPEEHIIVTTDPAKGNLRKIVQDHGLKSLPIPPGVGGRYSVLSAVGLLLAEAVGIDAADLLRGARDIHARCMHEDFRQNPAYLIASGISLMQAKRGRTMTVLVPYADRLKSFSEWFCQLWGESLGKEGKGLTPYPSTGTTDQHSQLQLWMEGPQDKVVVFIAVEEYGTDIRIPPVFKEMEGLNYLSGHTLAELIKVEQEASEIALAKNGRPSITVTVPRIDAYHLGQLFHFFAVVTALTGALIGVNPFDQPGVEEGKNLTYGMMGKKGYEAKREEFEKYRQRKNRIGV